MKFTPRVTMRDVAKAAGVHQATVSLALRHDRRIPEATRERVAAVADRLGYKPHPLVSAYAAACRASRKPSAAAGAVIAWIMPPIPGGARHSAHFNGAREAAEAQGYALEPFVMGREGPSCGRLETILHTRNIHGIIIAPLAEAHGRFDLTWERYCTVVIEYTFSHPALDRVVHDGYGGMLTALDRCRERGIRRAGLVLTEAGSERTEGLIDAAYWMRQKTTGSGLAAIPPLHLASWDEGRFSAWMSRHRPEVVVSSSTLMGAIVDFAKHRETGIPDGLSLINLNLFPSMPFAGIDQDNATLGATAARMVIDKLNRNDRGIPAVRQTVLIPGKWIEGKTLRDRPAG